MDSASRPSPSPSRTSERWTWSAIWESTSPRAITWASPSRSRRSGPRDPLKRDQEGLVGGARPLLQADLAGAVAAEVGVVARARELCRLLGRRRLRQLRMEHPAVARHPAAGCPDRLNDLLGHRRGDFTQLALE